MNLFLLHEKMTGHLFPAYSNTDERFLALALCGEAGELAAIAVVKSAPDNPYGDDDEAIAGGRAQGHRREATQAYIAARRGPIGGNDGKATATT